MPCEVSADTCGRVVHREEALLHERVLEVLVVHGDFSHHVAWHVTRESAGLAVVETIRVPVTCDLKALKAARLRNFA